MAKSHSSNSRTSRRRRQSSGDRSLFDDVPGDIASGVSGNGETVALHTIAQERYLHYALSVITARALPDVRDGLKPVQRRILHTMWQQNITAEAKHRKCAKVVGDVMGNFHPHGDMAIYDALVRMAQPFSMREVLIDGSGNFGSLDGDAPAAMRYTECRLAPIATQMLLELNQDTVPFRPNYDGSKTEPVVLPARVPNLLVNGATGIAVGMATNIPPHNLGEVCSALIKLIDNPELKTHHLCATIKGPDFPTGGQILNTPQELREIYQRGSGTVRVRATFELGEVKRASRFIYITSVPYMVNKATLVERVADVAINRKLPHLLDVKDVSTDDVRIALELKRDADEQKVMAYLYKHTPLQTNYAVNLVCLLPTENPQVGRPEKCDLREMLASFLTFRLQVVTSRLEHELAALHNRIHILEGFVTVFNAIDQIIRIVRASDGKQDAAKKIIKRFKLDAEQTDAILELKLYRLAKLEIQIIRKELADKRKRAGWIGQLLKDEDSRWDIVRDEIKEVVADFGHSKTSVRAARMTSIASSVDEPEFTAEDFIIPEDNHVLVTWDGWVKRQKEIRDPSTTRLREGDAVLSVFGGSTRATCVFFTNYGAAYTCRIIDIPATTGYGEPIQKLFKLKDGEKVVTAFGLDPRTIGDIEEDPQRPEYAPPIHAVAVTSDGYCFRFGLEPFVEPSTRNGRRYARPAKGAQVIGVASIHGAETMVAVTKNARALLCPCEEVTYLSGPGKGVKLIRLAKEDSLLGFRAAIDDRDTLTVKTSLGGQQRINTARYEVSSRGGKGRLLLKRGFLTGILAEESVAPDLPE